jgi:wobble nucleotide-excising tRNase
MHIDRIARLRDYGVFRDFTWRADLVDFGRYNLIYGWNGSGKTTLSRLFRAIERRGPITTGQATIRIDGNDVSSDAFPHAATPMRVFNRDFVQENVFPIGGGDVPPIFVIGKDSIEKQKEADRLKGDLATAESSLAAARSNKQDAEKAYDKFCVDQAKAIKGELRSPDSSPYNNYDKAAFQNDARRIAAENNAGSHLLDEAARETLLSQIRSAPKPKVQEVMFDFPPLQGLADSISGLLATTVVSAAIQSLKDDATLAEWTRHGLGLHKGCQSAKCLFCEQPLPEGRLTALEAHFSAEYERFVRRIDEQVGQLQEFVKAASQLTLPNRAELYDDLATDYTAAQQAVSQALSASQGFVGGLIRALNAKKGHMFTSRKLDVPVPTVAADVVDRVNGVIGRHNHACGDFQTRVSAARTRLALGRIAGDQAEFVRLLGSSKNMAAAIQSGEQTVKEVSQKIQRIEREIVQHRRPAEDLNEDLKKYLGHGELQLAIKETGYSVTRNGEPAQTLSEGEMTAIAILYFLKSLEDRGFDGQNGVVVLDDPVSSLDANAMYLAFSLIRNRTANVQQLFVLTHSFSFFRQVRNWFHYLPGQKDRDPVTRPSRFYMLECVQSNGQRAAVLRPLDRLLEKYESEYHFLFACVYRIANAPSPESMETWYQMPNVARRLLESFLAFRHPDAFDNLWGALRGVTTSDEARKSRILNFVQTHSHGPGVGQPEHDPSILGECQPILQEILRLIEEEDASHYAAMKKLVDPSGNGGREA